MNTPLQTEKLCYGCGNKLFLYDGALRCIYDGLFTTEGMDDVTTPTPQENYCKGVVKVLKRYPGITARMDLSEDSALVNDLANLLATREAEVARQAEDSALRYAHSFLDIFKETPDQIGYVLKNLDGDHYRKHRATKITLRAELESLNDKGEA